MNSSFERETPEPAFMVELGLHEVRRMLIAILDEDDYHECLKCNLLRCRCRPLTPRTPTASSWSELGSAYSSVEDASDGSFELIDTDFFQEEANEIEDASLKKQIAAAFRREQQKVEAKDIREWGKASRCNVVVNGEVLFRLSESINNKYNGCWPPSEGSVWLNPKPTLIPKFTIASQDIPSPIIPGSLDNIDIQPQVPQYNSREPWNCNPEVEDWLSKPWVRQPWFRHPFFPEVPSKPEPKVSLKTETIPADASPKSSKTHLPETRTWASLFSNPMTFDAATTQDPPLLNSPHKSPYSYGNPTHTAKNRFPFAAASSTPCLHSFGYWAPAPFPESLPKPEFIAKVPAHHDHIPQPMAGSSKGSSSSTPYWMSPVLSSGIFHFTSSSSHGSSPALSTSGLSKFTLRVAEAKERRMTSDNVAAFFMSFSEAAASTSWTRRLT